MFYAGFGLLAAEDVVYYSWVIRSMRTLLHPGDEVSLSRLELTLRALDGRKIDY